MTWDKYSLWVSKNNWRYEESSMLNNKWICPGMRIVYRVVVAVNCERDGLMNRRSSSFHSPGQCIFSPQANRQQLISVSSIHFAPEHKSIAVKRSYAKAQHVRSDLDVFSFVFVVINSSKNLSNKSLSTSFTAENESMEWMERLILLIAAWDPSMYQ